jgi:hypothetical protein
LKCYFFFNIAKNTNVKYSNKSSNKYFQESNPDSTFNLNEFKDYIINNLNAHNDLSLSCLERTIHPADLQQIAGDNIFESDGYIEEDDEDTPRHLSSNNLLNEEINDPNMEYYLTTPEEINNVLYKRMKFERKFMLNLTEHRFILDEEEREFPIIKAEDLITILEYFNESMNNGLIELNDHFSEERRKYFQVDEVTYISIIEHFLAKRDDFFVCILNDIMVKLNISQKVIDVTFHYYLEIADIEDKNVQDIRNSYNKLFVAGVK